MDGWIKLHRTLLDKAIWKCSTANQKIILIVLLLMANHKENQWIWNGKKYKVNAGQFITSVKSIKEKCGSGISVKNIRTALVKFENLDFLAIETANTGSLITIVNWELYQLDDSEVANQSANRWQTGGKRVATNKNDKNDKNDKNKDNKLSTFVDEIVEHLNTKTGKSFKSNSVKTKKMIKARLTEGFTVDDFKKVIDIKSERWLKTSDMSQYLRPETLFGTKFEGYLNEIVTNKDREEFLKDG